MQSTSKEDSRCFIGEAYRSRRHSKRHKFVSYKACLFSKLTGCADNGFLPHLELPSGYLERHASKSNPILTYEAKLALMKCSHTTPAMVPCNFTRGERAVRELNFEDISREDAAFPLDLVIDCLLVESRIKLQIALDGLKVSCTKIHSEKVLSIRKEPGKTWLVISGAPSGIRTLDLGIKSPLLWPAELTAQIYVAAKRKWCAVRDSNPGPWD